MKQLMTYSLCIGALVAALAAPGVAQAADCYADYKAKKDANQMSKNMDRPQNCYSNNYPGFTFRCFDHLCNICFALLKDGT